MKIYRKLVFAICVLALTACGVPESANSPTETLKKFIEASKTKDIETIKKLLSKSTIESIKKVADAQNTAVDEIILKDNGTPLKELPETRNEKIEGDTAAVEVKNKITGEFETIPFVKENGVWKIALDKFMRNILEKQQETADAPPSSADNTEANKPASSNK